MNDLLSVIRDVTERYRGAGYFPSACVRVFDRDRTLAVYCTEGVRENSLFDVASLTKIATATMVLLWAEEGTIALEDTMDRLFPEIAADEYLKTRLEGVTLHQLLTHTATITPWFPFYVRKGADFWDVFRHALKTTPRVEGMEYSDLNFMLLGKLCERLSSLPLEECLRKHLTEKLSLGQMLYRPSLDKDIIPSCFDNQIEMDMCRERDLVFEGFRPLHTPVFGTVNDGNAHYFFDDVAGHAGIFANAEAYERLCRFYMNSTLPLLQKAQLEQPLSPTRGLGLQTGLPYPHGCGHTGFTGTSIYFSTEYNIGVVAFTNRLYYDHKNPNMTGDFRRALHEAVFAAR